jgi:hypothetical protein
MSVPGHIITRSRQNKIVVPHNSFASVRWGFCVSSGGSTYLLCSAILCAHSNCAPFFELKTQILPYNQVVYTTNG